MVYDFDENVIILKEICIYIPNVIAYLILTILLLYVVKCLYVL